MEESKLAENVVAPGMQLELQLPDRECRGRGRTCWLVRLQECGQRVKFITLDVDLQHVNESVT